MTARGISLERHSGDPGLQKGSSSYASHLRTPTTRSVQQTPARQSLVFLLSAAGIAVRTFESATSFLKASPTLHGGCIVTDMRMPGMSGLDLQRRLNAMKSAMPVIMITGHGDIPLAVEAMRLGAVDFIEKPFESKVLLAAVRT